MASASKLSRRAFMGGVAATAFAPVEPSLDNIWAVANAGTGIVKLSLGINDVRACDSTHLSAAGIAESMKRVADFLSENTSAAVWFSGEAFPFRR